MPTPAPLLYRSLRLAVRVSLKIFYRRIEVTGVEHVRGDAPTILASNHPNSIIDPLLVGLFESRKVSFCARDGLFRIPLMGTLLRAVGAIPIRRRSDHSGGKLSNEGAFDACRQVLSEGGVISIFPEGHTHNRMKVDRLKTGTARIALDAEKGRSEVLGVRVVPIALNYLVRQAFRSDVHVAFGEPILVQADFGELAAQDPEAAVRALTDKIGERLRELAVHVEEAEDERIIAQVTSIVVGIRADQGLDGGGQSPAERVALAQRVVDAYRRFLQSEPTRIAELRRRLLHYVEERQRLGLGGERPSLQHRSETRSRRPLLFLLLGLPVAVFGLTGALLPYLAMRIAVAVMRPTTYRLALTKGLVGLMFFGSFFGLSTGLIALYVGPLWAVLYGALLPPAAVFSLRWTTELRLHRVSSRMLFHLLVRRDRLARLRHERELLVGELTLLRERYLRELG